MFKGILLLYFKAIKKNNKIMEMPINTVIIKIYLLEITHKRLLKFWVTHYQSLYI